MPSNAATTTRGLAGRFLLVDKLGVIAALVGLAISDGKNVADLPRQHDFFTVVGGDLFGVPVPVWVLLVTALTLTDRPACHAVRHDRACHRLQPRGGPVNHDATRSSSAELSGADLTQAALLHAMATGEVSS